MRVFLPGATRHPRKKSSRCDGRCRGGSEGGGGMVGREGAPVAGEMAVTSKRGSLWPPEPKRWDGQRLEKLTGTVGGWGVL